MEDVEFMEEFIQEESDTESVSNLSFCSSSSSCMTSVTDLSVYHEFDCMIAELHAIQESQGDVLHRLHSIREAIPLVEPFEEEIDEITEFKEAIQRFHLQSMHEIASSLPTTFTDNLLAYLDATLSEKESEDETE